MKINDFRDYKLDYPIQGEVDKNKGILKGISPL